MASMNCPECYKEAADYAESCINCGAQLQQNGLEPNDESEYTRAKQKNGWANTVIIVLFLFFAFLGFVKALMS